MRNLNQETDFAGIGEKVGGIGFDNGQETRRVLRVGGSGAAVGVTCT